nr:IclR family transcriptional regulator C-terminal domain-containing protein [Clostridium sp. MCC353]
MSGASFREDAVLRQELKQIALQGYAENSSDMANLPAVAAPVFNFSKNVVYVISLHSGLLADKKIMSKWILTLLDLAGRVSSDLGFVNYI